MLTAGVTATLICHLEEHLTRHDHVLLIAEPLVAEPLVAEPLVAEPRPSEAGEGDPLIYYRHESVPLRPGRIPA